MKRNIAFAVTSWMLFTANLASSQEAGQPLATALDAMSYGAVAGLTNIDEYEDSVLTFGLFADKAMDRNIMAGATIDYWTKKDMPHSDDLSLTNLIFGLNAKYLFTDAQAAFRPYAIGGLAVHRFSFRKRSFENAVGEGEVVTPREKTSIRTYFGLDLGAGVLYTMAPNLDLSGEVKYRAPNNDRPALSQLAFTVGISYRR